MLTARVHEYQHGHNDQRATGGDQQELAIAHDQHRGQNGAGEQHQDDGHRKDDAKPVAAIATFWGEQMGGIRN